MIITTKKENLRRVIVKDESGLGITGDTLTLFTNDNLQDSVKFVANAEGVIFSNKFLKDKTYKVNATSIGYEAKETTIGFQSSSEASIVLKKTI